MPLYLSADEHSDSAARLPLTEDQPSHCLRSHDLLDVQHLLRPAADPVSHTSVAKEASQSGHVDHQRPVDLRAGPHHDDGLLLWLQGEDAVRFVICSHPGDEAGTVNFFFIPPFTFRRENRKKIAHRICVWIKCGFPSRVAPPSTAVSETVKSSSSSGTVSGMRLRVMSVSLWPSRVTTEPATARKSPAMSESLWIFQCT